MLEPECHPRIKYSLAGPALANGKLAKYKDASQQRIIFGPLRDLRLVALCTQASFHRLPNPDLAAAFLQLNQDFPVSCSETEN